MARQAQHISHVWYRANLLPAADNIFTPSFYQKSEQVFFTKVSSAPTRHKVFVASKLHDSALRVMTLDLAHHCLQPAGLASPEETDVLNDLSIRLNRNI